MEDNKNREKLYKYLRGKGMAVGRTQEEFNNHMDDDANVEKLWNYLQDSDEYSFGDLDSFKANVGKQKQQPTNPTPTTNRGAAPTVTDNSKVTKQQTTTSTPSVTKQATPAVATNDKRQDNNLYMDDDGNIVYADGTIKQTAEEWNAELEANKKKEAELVAKYGHGYVTLTDGTYMSRKDFDKQKAEYDALKAKYGEGFVSFADGTHMSRKDYEAYKKEYDDIVNNPVYIQASRYDAMRKQNAKNVQNEADIPQNFKTYYNMMLRGKKMNVSYLHAWWTADQSVRDHFVDMAMEEVYRNARAATPFKPTQKESNWNALEEFKEQHNDMSKRLYNMRHAKIDNNGNRYVEKIDANKPLMMQPKVYVDKTGNEYDTADAANEMDDYWDEINAAKMDLADNIRSIIDEGNAVLEKNYKAPSGYNPMAMSSYVDVNTAFSPAASAVKMLKEALTIIDRVKDEGGDFWQGLKDGITNSRTWSFGLEDMRDAANAMRIKQKYESGEKLTEGEQILVKALALANIVEGEYAGELSKWYNAGKTTGEMAPFMIQMAFNPTSGAARKGGQYVAEKMASAAVQRISRRIASKEITEAAGKALIKDLLKASKKEAIRNMSARAIGAITENTISSIGLASTLQAVQVGADTVRRMTGDVKADVDDNGEAMLLGFENGKTLLQSFGESLGAMTIENWSEGFGEWLSPIMRVGGGTLSKIVSKMPGGKFMVELTNKAGRTRLAQLFDKTMERTKYNGIIGEYAEEKVGQVMNAMIVGDEDLSTFFDTDENLELLMCVAPLGFATGVVSLANYPIAKHNAKRTREKADKAASIIWKEDWSPMKEKIDNMTVENMGEIRESLKEDENDDADTKMKKSKARQYLVFTAAERTITLFDAFDMGRAEAMAMENGYSNENALRLREAERDGAEAETPDAMQRLNSEMDAATQVLAESGMIEEGADISQAVDNLGNNDKERLDAVENGQYTNEEKAALMTYIFARARQRAMEAVKIGEVNEAGDAAVREVDALVHQQSNQLVTAVTNDGRIVYVVRGDIENAYGDNPFWVIDAQSGEAMMQKGSQLDIQSYENADNVREGRRQAAREDAARSLAEQMDLPMRVDATAQAMQPGQNVVANIEGQEVEAIVTKATADTEGMLPTRYTVQYNTAEGVQTAEVAANQLWTAESVQAEQGAVTIGREGIAARMQEEQANMSGGSVEQTAEEPAVTIGETTPAVEEVTEEPAAPVEIPVGENGKRNYMAAGVDATVASLTEDGVSREDARDFAQEQTDAANTALTEARTQHTTLASNEPKREAGEDPHDLAARKAAWRNDVEQAKATADKLQAQADFWAEVSNRLNAPTIEEVEQAAIDAAEQAEEEVQSIDENHTTDGMTQEEIDKALDKMVEDTMAAINDKEMKGKHGVVHNGKTLSEMTNEEVKAAAKELGTNERVLRGLHAIAERLGMQVRFADYLMTKDGSTFSNAYVERGSRTIFVSRLSLAQGEVDGKTTVDFLLGHEITHQLRKDSESHYQHLARFVREFMGEDFDTEVMKKVALYKGIYDDSQLVDKAIEEVVCDFAGRMLRETDLLKDASNLKPGVIQSVIDAIERLLQKLLSTNDELEYKRNLERCMNAWKNALDYSTMQQNKGDNSLSMHAVAEDGKSTLVAEDGDVSFSLESRQAEKELLDAMYKTSAGKWARQDLEDMRKVGDSMMEGVVGLMARHPAFADWNERMVLHDKNGNPVYSVFINNQDTEAPTIELSRNCVKKEAMNNLLTILRNEGNLSKLDNISYLDLRELLKKHGYAIACEMCYVESKRENVEAKRKLEREWNNIAKEAGLGRTDILDLSEGVELTPKQKQKLDDIVKREGAATRLGRIANLMKAHPGLRGQIHADNLYTPEGWDELLRKYDDNHPFIKFLASHDGSNTAKPTFGSQVFSQRKFMQQYGELREYFGERGMMFGGFRKHSFSDADPLLFVDDYQIHENLALTKSGMFGYTKVPYYVDMWGETGEFINQSLVLDIDTEGQEARKYAGLIKVGDERHKKALNMTDAEYENYKQENGLQDGDWDYYFASESFPAEQAFRFRNEPRFGGRVGTVLVAPSDECIWKALDDPRIDVIIGWHSSNKMVKSKERTGYDHATDYVGKNETKGNRKTTDSDTFLPSIGVMATTIRKGNGLGSGYVDFNYNEACQTFGDAKIAAQAYLEWCDINGFEPMYSKFRDHENYYKLLADFRRYDEEGNTLIQGAIQMKLPEDWATKLDGYLSERETEYSKNTSGMAEDSALMDDVHKALGIKNKKNTKAKDDVMHSIDDASDSDVAYSIVGSTHDREYLNAIQEYDQQNGTELSEFVNDVRSGSTANPRRHYVVGVTGSILNQYGMTGNITIGRKAVNKGRHTPNSWHNFTMGDILDILLTINNPLYITKYRSNNQPNSYRIYTPIEIGGKTICVGIDVNKVGRDVFVSDIVTAFGRNVSSILTSGEVILYDKANQQSQQSSSAHNSQGYAGITDSVSKGTASSSNDKENAENSTKNSSNAKSVEQNDMLAHKNAQFDVIQQSNPMTDDVHTGIRSAEDIKTFDEANEEFDGTPDYTEADMQKAKSSGKVTVYSSYPIENGVFVSPSKMMAQDYAGNGKVYTKEVSTNDVAWIDSTEGQMAMYSLSDSDMQRKDGESLLDYAARIDAQRIGKSEDAETPSFSLVEDEEEIERLEKEPKIKVYRAMQLIDGKLYPPMSAKVNGKLRQPIELGRWERSEEQPEMADEKGNFKLDKGNKKSVPARYNPYFHTSPTPLNDQFSEAQSRPNLVTVEVEVPESELTSGYKADKAKDSVGRMEWKAGIIQGQLTGKREVILSRWDKPIRIVPDSEVADVIVGMFGDRHITMPSNVVTPSLRAELEKRGIPFVETDNRGRLEDGTHYSKKYGKKSAEGGEVSYSVDERQTHTDNFKRWFGDWEKDPEHSSKAVDEDGKPRVFYHGSDWNPLEEKEGNAVFKDEYRGTGSGDNGFYGYGHYFAFTEGEAEYYGRNVTKYYLDIKKPFYFSENLTREWEGKKIELGGDSQNSAIFMNTDKLFHELTKDLKVDVWNEMYESSSEQISIAEYAKIFKDVYENKKFIVERDPFNPSQIIVKADPIRLKAGNAEWTTYQFEKRLYDNEGRYDSQFEYTHWYMTDDRAHKFVLDDGVDEIVDGEFVEPITYFLPSRSDRHYMFESKAFTDLLKEKGYDGVFQSKNGDEVVVFEPNQIKSATDNNGEFSRENPDIRYSVDESSVYHSADWKRARRELKGDQDALDILNDTNPRDIYEVASQVIYGGKLLWEDEGEGQYRKKGVKSHLHWSNGERKHFQRLLGTSDQGGVSVEQMGEIVMSQCRADGIPFDEDDAMAGANAVMEVLRGARSSSDVRAYIDDARAEEATEHHEAWMEAYEHDRDEEYMDLYGMSYDEYEEMMSQYAESVNSDFGLTDKEAEVKRLRAENKAIRDKAISENRVLNAKEAKKVESNRKRISELKSEIRDIVDIYTGAKEDVAEVPSEPMPEKPVYHKGEDLMLFAQRMAEYQNQLRAWYKRNPARMDELNARKELIRQIHEQLKNEYMDAFDKRTLTKMLNRLSETDQTNLGMMLDEARDLVNGVAVKSIRNAVDRLLSMKVQGRNQKNQSVASHVDDTTRQVFDKINEVLKGAKATGLEDEMHKLRSENWHIREDARLELRELTDEEKAQIEANNTRVRELRDQREDILMDNMDQGARDVTSALTEKQQKAVDPSYEWTEKDDVELTALTLLNQLFEGEKALAESRNMEKEARKAQRMLDDTNASIKELDGVEGSEAELKELERKAAALRQQVRGFKLLASQAKQQYIDAMQGVADNLSEHLENGRIALQNELMEERERRNEIIRKSLHDVSGTTKKRGDNFEKESKEEGSTKFTRMLRGLISDYTSSFAHMAQRIATKTMGKDSFFYKHFVEGKDGVVKANDKYVENMRNDMLELDKACREIFGMGFEEAYRKRKSTIQYTGIFTEQLNKEGEVEMKEMPMSEDVATYLWMLWKQDDGKAKLMQMGYTEQSMEQIASFIGTANIEFAEWVQEKFLKDKRVPYNDAYKAIHHTSLAEIEHYFPIRTNSTERREEIKLDGDSGKGAGSVNVRTGSSVNRTVNVTPISMMHGAFSVLVSHLQEVNEFIAFSKVRQELQWALSNTEFKNYVNQQHHGAFKRLHKAAQIATRSNTEESDTISQSLVWLNRGLVGGNIAYRPSTAFKQMLSVFAYFGYSENYQFWLHVIKNIGGQYGRNLPAVMITSFAGIGGKKFFESAENGTNIALSNTIAWCMQNIPDFRERVLQGVAGTSDFTFDDESGIANEFLKKYMKRGMYLNKMVDAITVAIGIKSIYDYNMSQAKKRAKKMNLTGDEMNQFMEDSAEVAKMDAVMYYNTTQQSNGNAFLSPAQTSKSFWKKATTLYKNSPISYARKVAEGLRDIYRWASPKYSARMIEEYQQQMLDEGMELDEAKKAARAKVNNKARKSAFEVFLYGIIMNHAWNIGGKGLLGMLSGIDPFELLIGGGDDRDDDGEMSAEEYIAYYLSLPMQGVLGIDLASNFINSMLVAKQNPNRILDNLLSAEMANIGRDWYRLSQENGMFSPQMGFFLLNRALRFSGINPDVLYNNYLGVERLMRGGWKDGDELTSDIMLLMQSPESNRAMVAKNLFGDRPIEEYMQCVERAMKYNVFDDDYEGWATGLRKLSDQAESKLIKEFITDHINTPAEANACYDSTNNPKLRKKILERKKFLEETPEDIFKKFVDKANSAQEKQNKGKMVYDKMNESLDLHNDKWLDETHADMKKQRDDLKEATGVEIYDFKQAHPGFDDKYEAIDSLKHLRDSIRTNVTEYTAADDLARLREKFDEVRNRYKW